MLVFGAVAACLSLHLSAVEVEPPPVLPIVGGNEAGSCEFPSAVAILEGDETPVMCSGTLVHPNVVTLAAHCVNPERPIVGVGFGEQGQGEVGPARTVGVEDCVGHPQYFQSGYPDVAYCVLSEPVLDVPTMPILAGCELDALEPGLEVTIVGFGASYGTVVMGEVSATGVGPKRFTTQTIDEVDPSVDEVHMVGLGGSQSACFGDSGGPALVQLSDGTWRVFGAASRLYDPGGFPPPEEPENVCGVGVTYGLLTTQLAWLETETGFDLTPCHDDAGQWEPTVDCGDFPMSPGVGVGSWDMGCAGGAVGGGEPVCEPAVGTSTGGEGTSTGEPPDDSSSGGESTTGFGAGTGDDTTTSGSAGTSAGGSSTSPVDIPETSGEGSSSGEPGAEEDAAGCGCRGGAPSGAPLWLGLGLLGLRRRR